MMVMLGFGRSDCVGAPRPGVHEWGKKESFRRSSISECIFGLHTLTFLSPGKAYCVATGEDVHLLVDLNGAASHLITSHFDITKEGKLACREATLSRSTVWKKKSL